MKNASLFLTLVFCLLTASIASGQVIKLRTTSIAFKNKINDYSWGNWSDWETTSMLIVIDFDRDRITIYSKEKQVYDIAEYEPQTTDDDGDDTFPFYCINEEGLTCRVRMMKLNSKNGRKQIYVDFDDLKWVYEVYALD